MHMLWDLYQQSQIRATQAKVESASNRTKDVRDSVLKLEDRTDRLALTTMAMWALMSEKLGITEADLEAKIQEIDLSDGRLDGKVRVQAKTCPSCNRKLSKRHNKCMYCGADTSPGLGSL